jgi:hypothetical protein
MEEFMLIEHQWAPVLLLPINRRTLRELFTIELDAEPTKARLVETAVFLSLFRFFVETQYFVDDLHVGE